MIGALGETIVARVPGSGAGMTLSRVRMKFRPSL
jgi:hypothetical protein